MKILNLYAGIGGNRKLWTPKGDEHDITAVELDPKIAKIYQDFFPKDKMIVADAHQYLLDHFKEFEFIWSSPPCPTHSRLNTMLNKKGINHYPDMRLYQEIIFLKKWFYRKFCIENVISYYEPFIKPIEVDNHYFWTNFFIGNFPKGSREHCSDYYTLSNKKGFDIKQYKDIDYMKILHNCVQPELGLHILNFAMEKEKTLFEMEKI